MTTTSYFHLILHNRVKQKNHQWSNGLIVCYEESEIGIPTTATRLVTTLDLLHYMHYAWVEQKEQAPITIGDRPPTMTLKLGVL